MGTDMTGLSPAKVLAGLYNASRPQGMGFLHYDPTPMTEVEAADLLTRGDYFDYLKGRVMKIRIPETGEIEGRLYDRDNGDGACEAVITSLRESDPMNAVIRATHEVGKAVAAESAMDAMGEPSTVTGGPFPTLTLGGADVAPYLGPAIDRAMNSYNEGAGK
jgi:hypothetical protein